MSTSSLLLFLGQLLLQAVLYRLEAMIRALVIALERPQPVGPIVE
jgi:hypothetical protein